MLAIRMRKMGSKKRPFFRVVVIDSRTARDSSFVEIVGHYNPRTKPAKVEIDRERIDHWVGKGAQVSDTVRTLLKRHASKPASAARRGGGQGARRREQRSRRHRVGCEGARRFASAGLGDGDRSSRHDADRGDGGAARCRQADRTARPDDSGDANDRVDDRRANR